MPEYLAPGVYVEEISTGPRPIQGVSTSLAGFVGLAERGPSITEPAQSHTDEPTFVSSWAAYQRWYGRWTPGVSYLADAVQGFFDNGGRRAFVARVTGDGGANLGAPSSLVVGNLVLTAIGRGAWGDRVYALIEPGTLLQTEFRLTLVYFTDPPPAGGPVDPLVRDVTSRQNAGFVEPDVVEVYDNLAPADGVVNSAETVVNAASRLVRLSWQGGVAAMPPTDPNPNTANAAFVPLANGDDGAVPAVAATFTPGIEALERIDEISLLVVPDEVRFPANTVTGALINQCERLRDRFAVVSAVQAPGNIAGFRPPRDTSYAAFYHPWIDVFNPRLNRATPVPPTGHVAGIIARTDIERGVHKAPANEVVVGAGRLVTSVTFADQTILNPRGVNCIRDFGAEGRGIRLWGARTMSSDPEWKYVNVRRLFLYLEESIDEGTQWVVFEGNNEELWAKVRRTIENFLVRVWRSGALMGTTQDEAFFVRCDRSTMTQDDIDNGRLICLIGVAPVKPAEFVIFRISQKTADASS
jgi:phage tail sheath protein FI